MDIYRTIAAPAEGLYKEKGSRFLAFAFPVQEEGQIKIILSELKGKYHDARHRCYAYMIGVDEGALIFRVSDDGEPSSTAGRPILGQIRTLGLTNVLIVVVRYFGGTKLGVSGLATAYKMAAADALAHAEIVEQSVRVVLDIQFDYAELNSVMRIIKEVDAEVLRREYGEKCKLTVSVRKTVSSYFCNIFNVF
ncbi:hypothetical protein FACS1894121_0540 [Bacteroidia bacterium]|nr:hypothetical protein FACS1894121_0540 [Bacteroidia bacterium]